MGKKIILVGYMGVGKSVLGAKLAEKLSIPFFDTDSILERQENKSITDIFKDNGEEYFRIKESLLLRELVKNKSFVMATGGGLPIYKNNMQFINSASTSVFIIQSPFKIYKRIHNESHRPLVGSQYGFVDMYYKRLPIYRQARIKVLNLGRPEDIVLRILKKID